ncbi:DEAD/DEAH box helicase [Pelomonas aquatica]|jgi:superfamily II DNA or RNA helicase|uniref:DEAD/DEAH box helicase n=1 Tax=Pelomonas aquatica TaxID=431058 RepID=A0A9X4LLI4_9BURK|nr:DEAD/DEAH box helicase [Pelomonas aquatica]MCY4754474.1 DEAD/DEAH box helicase [Pelomonas aquatica]MDG0865161.1 DEAD/DEAH box helicase [Pelomonas aquatica]
MPPSIADSLRRHVPATTFQRGQALCRAGCVLNPGIEPLGEQRWHLHGEVQGSMPQPYETSALVEAAADGAVLRFEGDCSCPVGLDCKHAVALALRLAAQWQGEGQSPSSLAAARLARWLDRFDAEAAAAPASGDVPVYLLSEMPRRAGEAARLQLGWAVSHPLKRGGWARPRAPGYDAEYRLRALQAGAAGDDAECVRLIRALGQGHYGYVSAAGGALAGQAGLLALQLCAGTGRLFPADQRGGIAGGALRWGAARTLGWQWQPAGEGGWALQPTLPDAAARAYAGPPALYVDPQAGECGPLLAPGIAPQRLALLFEAPPVPAAAFAAAQPRLLERLAGLPLPPTVEAPSAWPRVLPVARLRLALRPRPERDARGLLVAQLAFDYGGLRGHWPDGEAVKLAEHEGRRVLLTRDLPAEAAAQASLAALGLSPEPAPAHGADTPQWLAWAAEGWRAFREAGFEIDAAPALDELVHTAEQVDIRLDEQGAGDAAPGASWFDLSLGLEIDGVRHNVLPWLPALLAQLRPGADGPELPEWLWRELPDGRWLRLPAAPLRPWLAALLELVGERGLAVDALRLSHVEALRLGASLGEGARWDGADRLQALLGQLAGGMLPDTAPPAGLAAELRPYQRRGLDWLQFLRAQGLGGVLADDMGLGKTLQTLAHLLCEQQAGRLDAPCLVVAPVSLLGNWRREAARFAPALRTRVWHGSSRHDGDFAQDCDLLIAPYSLLQRDRERWLAQRWHVVVLDEAQHIKNASTQAAQVVSALDARQRIALSGTPLENHLGELWSLFHFLMPGFLGSQARFKTLFRTPIEKQGLAEPLQRLRRRVTPFMLRRTREAVAAELPPRIESTLPVTLEGGQADLYETIRLATERTVREALAAQGLARSQIQVLDALLKLRQACCDPRLVKGVPAAAKARASAKLALLMELLSELLAEGRRVLLFSQFTSMLALIEAELAAAGLSWAKLTGQTQKRDAAIERFTSGAVPLFLISLKAGGTGLNLPQADVVIHYDPWWNPAVEAQATARAHRIGQTRQVLVYRLVAEGTIEERMLALQARKAALAQGLLEGAAAREQPLFTEDDLTELLRPLGAL